MFIFPLIEDLVSRELVTEIESLDLKFKDLLFKAEDKLPLVFMETLAWHLPSGARNGEGEGKLALRAQKRDVWSFRAGIAIKIRRSFLSRTI